MIKVTQKPGEEVPTDVLATAIVDIAAGIKKIRTGRLNEKGLLVLLKAATGVPEKTLRLVLSGLEGLERDYVKPVKA